jgi:hypothetical protein
MVSSRGFRMAAVIAACVAALALAACGDDDEDTTTAPTTTPTGATGATGEAGGAGASEADVQQMETMLVEQGGYTQEEAECVAPKVLDEAGSLEDVQKNAQKLIQASQDALAECGASP